MRGPFVTEEELKLLLYVGEQEGIVEQEEREMIHGILEMTDKTVREVMVPRVDVVAVGGDRLDRRRHQGDHRVRLLAHPDLRGQHRQHRRRRLREGPAPPRRRSATISAPLTEVAREPYFTPEAKHVGELLREMKERKVHIAVVVDEHGGTAGIVTFEDLIEEIVGPIRDEYDMREVEELQIVSDHEVVVSARFPVDDLKEALDLEVPDVEADTVGGLVYERLGEIPEGRRDHPARATRP